MEDTLNKRKINCVITLKGIYIHRKCKEDISMEQDEPQVLEEMEKKENKSSISPFQLVVVKIPWYRKMMRRLLSYFGYYYE